MRGGTFCEVKSSSRQLAGGSGFARMTLQRNGFAKTQERAAAWIFRCRIHCAAGTVCQKDEAYIELSDARYEICPATCRVENLNWRFGRAGRVSSMDLARWELSSRLHVPSRRSYASALVRCPSFQSSVLSLAALQAIAQPEVEYHLRRIALRNHVSCHPAQERNASRSDGRRLCLHFSRHRTFCPSERTASQRDSFYAPRASAAGSMRREPARRRPCGPLRSGPRVA